MPNLMNIFLAPRFAESYKTNPLLLVDVGARGGLKRDWEAARPYLWVVGFEPEQREFEKLAQRTTADNDSTRISTWRCTASKGRSSFTSPAIVD